MPRATKEESKRNLETVVCSFCDLTAHRDSNRSRVFARVAPHASQMWDYPRAPSAWTEMTPHHRVLQERCTFSQLSTGVRLLHPPLPPSPPPICSFLCEQVNTPQSPDR